MRPTLKCSASVLLTSWAATGAAPTAPHAATYNDFISFFAEWRAFQKPRLVNGVPDYTSKAMATQQTQLAGYRKRLAAFDPHSWSIAQQVDFHILRAEMNGLDFDHRILKPWARNPAFYVSVVADESDQPAREGPFAFGTIELWRWQFPLTEQRARDLAEQLAPVPVLLQQARRNLTGDARDLWVHGIRSMKAQRAVLAELTSKVGPHQALAAAVQGALDATDGFIRWLEEQAPSKKGRSGVGIENYNWYLANVQLLPYTWSDEMAVCQRELARAKASLAVEEQKNRSLPLQNPINSAEEFRVRGSAAVTEYIAFLEQHQVLTIRSDMEPALRAHLGQYTAARPLEFFTEVDYRDLVLMRTHGYHWFDLARMQHEPHPSPVRRGALLYNIFNTRTEGFATAMEELMMHAGLCDARPRSRELVYILLAQRAARAIGELRVQANQLSLEEAAAFASANTPRGWLPLEGHTVWGEQHLYLQQPGYGTSYVIGKIEIDKLLAERARQLGAEFTLRRFMDEKDAVGLIPVSLLRWELTGESRDVPGAAQPMRQ